jgi:hypothetical protein
MSDLDVVLRGTLARFHRNACCPEAAGAELDSFVKQIKALFGAEIDRLATAKRRALALADERAKEANQMQSELGKVLTLVRRDDCA